MSEAAIESPRGCSRVLWATRVRAAYGQTVEAVFQVGRELLAAKAALPHGEFLQMVERELPFSARAAQMYIAIASSENFQIRTNGTYLPSSWRTLSVLARLEAATFDAAVKAGKIHPEMTRADAEALFPNRALAPVVPLSEAPRASVDAALREGGKLIAEYLAEEAALDRLVADLGESAMPSPETRLAEARVGEVLALLRRAHTLLKADHPRLQFNHRWAEASRLASAIHKRVEELS